MIVSKQNLPAFKIWLGLLGYKVKNINEHGAFSFKNTNKGYGVVISYDNGSKLAVELGREFEGYINE